MKATRSFVDFFLPAATIAGMAAGAGLGYRVEGAPGIGAGLMSGAVIGMIFALTTGVAIDALWTALASARKHRSLSPTFGRYWNRDEAARWKGTKDTLEGGRAVRGKIVSVSSSGLFVDLGVGFPAFLPGWENGDPDWRPRIGDDAEALLLSFDDDEREIVVTRRARYWVVWKGVPVGHLSDVPFAKREQALTSVSWLTNSARDELQRLVGGMERADCTLVRGDELRGAPYRASSGPAPTGRIWVGLRSNLMIAYLAGP